MTILIYACRVALTFTTIVLALYALRHPLFGLIRISLRKSPDMMELVGFSAPSVSVLVTMHNEEEVAADVLHALAVDGNSTQDAGVHVTWWIDSGGELEIGSRSIVLSRATAGRLIRLGSGSKVASAYAPLVASPDVKPDGTDESATRPAPAHEIPDRIAAEGKTAGAVVPGLDAARLYMLNAETWLYDGNLAPSLPLSIAKTLIVKGDCSLAPGSILEGDPKVGLQDLPQGWPRCDDHQTWGGTGSAGLASHGRHRPLPPRQLNRIPFDNLGSNPTCACGAPVDA